MFMVYLTMTAIGAAVGLITDVIIDPDQDSYPTRTVLRVGYGALAGLLSAYIMIGACYG